MSILRDSISPENSYVIDAESEAEVARVFGQSHLLAKLMGIFPQEIELSTGQTVLDVACGPAEWALSVAQQFPNCQVTGVDVSQTTLEFAQKLAQVRQIPNIEFRQMDVRKSLDFPDNSFDIIHARFIAGFMSTKTWPVLIHECFRVTRPGGMFCTNEFECMGVTNSLAMTQYNSYFVNAMRRAGQCFSPQGDQIGISAVQAHLLQEAGFTNIRQTAYANHFSAGMPGHPVMNENYKALMKLMQPFLIETGVTTREEIDKLYAQVLADMEAEDFRAVVYYHATWGQKSL